jgi:hypothetical protein
MTNCNVYPADGVYWRDEADVVLLVSATSALRLCGEGAVFWRNLAARGGSFNEASDRQATINRQVLAALVSRGLLIPGKDSDRWNLSHLLHVPAGV